MSLVNKEKIKCPKCKKESDFDIWKTINVTIDPEIKEKVLDGSIILFECPFCNDKNNIIYSFLYNDMDQEYMIWYLSNGEKLSDIKKYSKKSTSAYGKLKLEDKCRYRVVRNYNELIEKIKIFDDKLDDLVIESMKFLVLNAIPEEKKYDWNCILYESKSKKSIAYYVDFGEYSSTCEIPIEYYNETFKRFKIKYPKNFEEINIKTIRKYVN